jgi:lysophospholipase
MVLSAPMVALAREIVGTSSGVARAYAEILAALGLGSRYVPNGSDMALEIGPFEGNPITSDPIRYQRNAATLEAAPHLGLGSPTIAWLRAAYRSMARISSPDYPTRVVVPLLLFAAGNDRIVSTPAIEALALRLKVGTHILIPQARHEVLQETDEIRKYFWAAFDAYLGVDAAAA